MAATSLFKLILKEFHLELRKKSVVAGLFLYLAGTIFIYYLTFLLRENLVNPFVWSALLWVTILFTAINTIAKSFMGERKPREIYYYSLLTPESIIVSKIIYNFLLCSVLSSIGYILFLVFLGSPIHETSIFFLTMFLSSLGFSTTLTLLSALSSRTDNGHILMAVLGFPVIIGILLMSIKITKNCIDDLGWSANTDELITLGAINILATAISYLLFPYIWRS